MIKKVKLIGQEYDLGFDFSVLCTYAEVFGEELDSKNWTKTTGILKTLYAAVKSFNDDKEIPLFKEFSHKVKNRELNTVSVILFSLINDFYYTTDEEPDEDKESNP